MTSDYNLGKFSSSLASAPSRAAYLITRLPATYAACSAALAEIARLAVPFAPSSLLDMGAGPGTAAWAATEVWDSLREITLLENNREIAATGQRLAKIAEREALRSATWNSSDIRSTTLPEADLVILSYALGELDHASAAVDSAWKAARGMLVIVEPGTPRNFATLAPMRLQLIAHGGYLVAPCPHEKQCPMAISGDWCHFASRLERSALHRQMKGGALGYEDEKFSYLAFSKGKDTAGKADARIVRHPLIHSGHIKLSLCEPDGLREQTVTRSQKAAFRAARRAKWGDEWRQLE